MIVHWTCVECGKSCTVEEHPRRKALTRKFCGPDCSRAWWSSKRQRERAALRIVAQAKRSRPRHAALPCAKCLERPRAKGSELCRMCQTKPLKLMHDRAPLPPDFARRRAKILAIVDPMSEPDIACRVCGTLAEVQGHFDFRIMETVPWEVCPNGHYTKVERRRIA